MELIAMRHTTPMEAPAGAPDHEAELASFTRFVEEHQASVRSVAWSATGDRGLGEEIAQETFLIAWRKLRTGSKAPNLPAWLRTVARNLARNARRKGRREQGDDGLDSRPSPGPSPLDTLIEREARARLDRALLDLPSRYREPLILYYLSGESIEQVAAGLALSAGAVKQRLSRARKRLKADEIGRASCRERV